MKHKLIAVLSVVLIMCLISVVATAQTAPAWQNNTAYKIGDMVTFNGLTYQCQIAHTSQADWTPDVAHSLWLLIQGGGAADFTLTASPAQQPVLAGNAVSYTVSVGAVNGFTGTVALSVTGVPNGATATFSASSINTSGSSTLTISTAATAAASTSTLTVTGTSGAVSHTATVTLTVTSRTPDFLLTASPASQTVSVGGSTTYTISVTPVNGFTGTVSLSVTGLPVGATPAFNPASVNTSGTSTLTVFTTASTPGGPDTLTVSGTSGSLNHTAIVTLNVGGIKPSGTTGTIHFHLLLGVGNAQDSLTLDGDNFTDLIMSNMIAGVMYGHMVQEYAAVPGVQFNKDYLYGSVMGQLLQENISTEEYQSSTNFIDPASDQQVVMAVGQGGPYQINNYAVDLVGGGVAPEGHSLINYIAIQKNIGFTVANAAGQFNQPTPPSFNNKFYGPMLPAYFHYNDFVALNVIGKAANGAFTPPWQPQYDQTLANFVNLPNSFLDVILNEAYNQGYYGGLVAQSSKLGATATAATVATVNSYTSVWGNTSTFVQYPYQVHYYLDQMYDNPVPTGGPTTFVTPNNHIFFNMNTLENVFSNVFQTLAHSDGTSPAQFFTATQAQTAFNSALATNGVSTTATLDLSNATDRAKIFAVIDGAIGNLETAVNMKFNATTLSQL